MYGGIKYLVLLHTFFLNFTIILENPIFILGLYTEVLHCFGGTADRCRVSIYPYRWQAQGVRGSGLALTAMYTPLSH